VHDAHARSPYAGFILESTSGVSSAAKSNTFSINQAIHLEDLPIETKLEFQARGAPTERRGGCAACLSPLLAALTPGA
jgi:hypothetical protein